jgi:hypothetical protein
MLRLKRRKTISTQIRLEIAETQNEQDQPVMTVLLSVSASGTGYETAVRLHSSTCRAGR